MKQSTFSVLFFLKRSKVKKNGQCPIIARITVDGQTVQFNTKLEAEDKYWVVSKQRINSKHEQATFINTTLENIYISLCSTYHEILNSRQQISAVLVKNTFLGLNAEPALPPITILQEFDEFNKEFLQKALLDAGVKKLEHLPKDDRGYKSYTRYLLTRKRLAEFIAEKYGEKDMEVKEITTNIFDILVYHLMSPLESIELKHL